MAVAGDICAVVFSVAGILRLGYAIYSEIEDTPDGLKTAANFIVPWPNVVSFLLFSAIRNSQPLGEIAVITKGAFDLYGYAATGAVQLADALTSDQK